MGIFGDIPIYHDDLMNMIYEDKYSKKYYILMVRDNNLKLIKIKNKYKKKDKIKNFFESENDLNQFTQIIKGKTYFKGCIINKSDNNFNSDYLYLLCGGNFIIIDLLNKKIIENIKLNKYANSILNWNNDNLILQFNDSFYIFDTRINKIISKYSDILKDEVYIESIKTLLSVKNNFYFLFYRDEKMGYKKNGNIYFYISN